MSYMSKDFNEIAGAIAEAYTLDVNDVKKAYEKKPQVLDDLFNVMKTEKEARGKNVRNAAILGVLSFAFLPVAVAVVFPLRSYHEHSKQLEQIGKTVRDEISKNNPAPR